MKRASLIAGACVLAVAALAVLDGCYPRECDPAKDPLQCKCPPGACGPYPSLPADAGDAS